MTIDQMREFLGWCAVMNLGLLLWWCLFIALAHDRVYRLHGKWFKLSIERFDAIHYAGMAFFKLFVFLFNVVPYFALRIMR